MSFKSNTLKREISDPVSTESYQFEFPNKESAQTFGKALRPVFNLNARGVLPPILRLGLTGKSGAGKTTISKSIEGVPSEKDVLEKTWAKNQIAFKSHDLGTVRHYDLGCFTNPKGRNPFFLNAALDENFRERYPQGLEIIEHAHLDPIQGHDYLIRLEETHQTRTCQLTCSPENGSQNPAFLDFLKKVELFRI